MSGKSLIIAHHKFISCLFWAFPLYASYCMYALCSDLSCLQTACSWTFGNKGHKSTSHTPHLMGSQPKKRWKILVLPDGDCCGVGPVGPYKNHCQIQRPRLRPREKWPGACGCFGVIMACWVGSSIRVVLTTSYNKPSNHLLESSGISHWGICCRIKSWDYHVSDQHSK